MPPRRRQARARAPRGNGFFGARSRTGKDQRAQLVAWVNSVKSTPCADCGLAYPPCVMDFDHLPGVRKRFTIAEFLRKHGGDEGARLLLEEEIRKCQVVCSNCHRLRTSNRARGRIFSGKAKGRPGACPTCGQAVEAAPDPIAEELADAPGEDFTADGASDESE